MPARAGDRGHAGAHKKKWRPRSSEARRRSCVTHGIAPDAAATILGMSPLWVATGC